MWKSSCLFPVLLYDILLVTCISSLQSVVDKPPVGGKELNPLPSHALSGFRLNPGPVSTESL